MTGLVNGSYELLLAVNRQEANPRQPWPPLPPLPARTHTSLDPHTPSGHNTNSMSTAAAPLAGPADVDAAAARLAAQGYTVSTSYQQASSCHCLTPGYVASQVGCSTYGGAACALVVWSLQNSVPGCC